MKYLKFENPVGENIFLSSIRSTLAVGPTQSPTEGAQQPVCKFDHSPPSSAVLKDKSSHTPTPLLCVHGVSREISTFFFIFDQLQCLERIPSVNPSQSCRAILMLSSFDQTQKGRLCVDMSPNAGMSVRESVQRSQMPWSRTSSRPPL